MCRESQSDLQQALSSRGLSLVFWEMKLSLGFVNVMHEGNPAGMSEDEQVAGRSGKALYTEQQLTSLLDSVGSHGRFYW